MIPARGHDVLIELALNWKQGGNMEVDIHGYHPDDIDVPAIVQQAWEMGQTELRIIHGHGRNRGRSPGFVNTNTGLLGLRVRVWLRRYKELRKLIKYTTLDGSDKGVTSVRLKPNATPTRAELDFAAFGWARYSKEISE